MKTTIIDVREPEEYANSHVQGAVNIPLSEVIGGKPSFLKQLDRGTPVILYCASGGRSGIAIQELRARGFTDLTNGINVESVNNLLSKD